MSDRSDRNRKKSKSGCRTCKHRKVKCDEQWPVCHRCRSTGRHCEGYGIYGGGSLADNQQHKFLKQTNINGKSDLVLRNSQASLGRPVPLFILSADERNCLEWYMCRSATKLAGAFHSEQATSTLFQSCQIEKAVLHAVVALASVHIEEVRGGGMLALPGSSEQSLFTIQQYGKAIKSLQAHFATNERALTRIALLVCTLLVFIDFLREHYAAGIIHLEHGLKLIRQLQINANKQGRASTFFDGMLVMSFTRILVQAKLLGHDLKIDDQCFWISDEFQIYPHSFDCIHLARQTLENILLSAIQLRSQANQAESVVSAKLSAAALECQNSLQHELQVWKQTYQKTLPSLATERNSTQFFANQLLHIYYHITVILTGSCLGGEMKYDEYESDFVAIILRVIAMYRITFSRGMLDYKRVINFLDDPESSSPNSSSDMGCLAPLYFTAIKSRNHHIRHQAIKLLETTNHKEGIWNARLTTTVAKKVAELEEGHFYDYLDYRVFDDLAPPSAEDLDTPPLPEQVRFNNVNVVLPADRTGKLLLKCSRRNPKGATEWVCKKYDLPSQRWNNIPATEIETRAA